MHQGVRFLAGWEGGLGGVGSLRAQVGSCWLGGGRGGRGLCGGGRGCRGTQEVVLGPSGGSTPRAECGRQHASGGVGTAGSVNTGPRPLLSAGQHNAPPHALWALPLQDHDNQDLGVVGSVELLSNRTLSSQPVCSVDFSPDKEGLFCCAAFDQTLR